MRLSYDVDDTPETIEQWVEGSVHRHPRYACGGAGIRVISPGRMNTSGTPTGASIIHSGGMLRR